MTLASTHRRALAVLLLALAPLSACSVRKVARDVADAGDEIARERAARPEPGPVASAVRKVLDDPRTQQAAASMMREVAREGVVGAVEGGQASTVIQQITPPLEAAARSAMTSAVEGAVDAVNRDPQAIERVTAVAGQSMGRGLSAALTDPSPDGLRPALGGLVREASREAVAGASEGLRGLEPTADPQLRRAAYQAGYVFGEGFGRGMPTGMADNRGFLLVLGAMLVAVSLLGGAALFALWKQNQAMSRALLLLAQRLEPTTPAPPAEPDAPPSRRPPTPRLPSPSLA